MPISLAQPANLREQIAYIAEHYARIYVRACPHGKWGSFSLAELPDEDARGHVISFIALGQIPARLLEDAPGAG